MDPVCIVTDSAVQFPQHSFPGKKLIHLISLTSQISNQEHLAGNHLKPQDLPTHADDNLRPRLVSPGPESIRALFASLAQRYNTVLCILTSASLNMVFQDAQTAASSLKGGAEIQVIDSQTISVGLGFLVESAASAIAAGRPAPEVELLVRSLIPRIYGMLCIPGLSYLHYNGFVDLAQATVTEMLGLMPVFTIEEGQFSPMEKLKNHRQAASLFQEFMDEFDHLQHIAYVQSAPPNLQEAHFLRDHAREYFPDTPFTSHSINLSLSTLLGPRATGAFVIESVE